MITFNTDGMVAQRFPFPAPIMDYIFKNLQPKHLIKLYKCCKFFYAKYRQNIILNLEIVDVGEQEIFDPIKTTIRGTNSAIEKLHDFWITDKYVYHAIFSVKRIYMPFFSHCTVKKLEVCENLVWNEFEAMTNAGTVEDLIIGRIFRDDGEQVPVEQIIAKVPNATSIQISKSLITSITVTTLAALNRQVKFSTFVLANMTIEGEFELNKLESFLVKHADLDCNVRFDFQLMPEEIDEFRVINDLLRRLSIQYNETADLILRNMKHEKEFALRKKKEYPN